LIGIDEYVLWRGRRVAGDERAAVRFQAWKESMVTEGGKGCALTRR
jgi:hypothetical protein